MRSPCASARPTSPPLRRVSERRRPSQQEQSKVESRVARAESRGRAIGSAEGSAPEGQSANERHGEASGARSQAGAVSSSARVPHPAMRTRGILPVQDVDSAKQSSSRRQIRLDGRVSVRLPSASRRALLSLQLSAIHLRSSNGSADRDRVAHGVVLDGSSLPQHQPGCAVDGTGRLPRPRRDPPR